MAGEEWFSPFISKTEPLPCRDLATNSPISFPTSILSAPIKAVYFCESVLRSNKTIGIPLSKALSIIGVME